MTSYPAWPAGSHHLNRRNLLKSAAIVAALGDSGIAAARDQAQAAPVPADAAAAKSLTKKTIGFMLGSEQFMGPQLVENGEAAARAGFGLLATSDHFPTLHAHESPTR